MIARGTVVAVREETLDVRMPALGAGRAVRIAVADGWRHGVVVRSAVDSSSIAITDSPDGIVPGAPVEEELAARASLGTVALAKTIPANFHVAAPSIDASRRTGVAMPLWTGVRAIDAVLTIGRGARVGIFGAPGAGKSTLLETIIDGVEADAVVLGLIGERGREAERWIARCDARTTIVCATSDRPARERVAAAHTAFAQAHALARRGLHVLLVLDSLARVAYALRERASKDGETLGRGGYPASTFATLARIVESAGSFEIGSITLVATVLSDGDDRDPVSEAARSLLDGHITLSSDLAHAGRFPAIDILASASRTMHAVVGPQHRHAAGAVRRALGVLEQTRDLRSLGIAPADSAICRAVDAEAEIEALLRQAPGPVDPARSLAMLLETADTLGEPHGYHV